MSTIETLPFELIVAILQKLDNIHSLLSSILTCHNFHNVYQEYPSVRTAVFRRQLTPALLPYSLAVYETSRLPPLDREDSIRDLVNTLHETPHNLTAQPETLPLSTLLRLGRTHEAITRLVAEFASTASALLSQDEQGDCSDLTLSENESLRFFRSFYRVEIYFTIFPGEKELLDFDPSESSDVGFFFSKYTVWEIEEVACVHDFLEERISQSTVDILTHDVAFGEFSADYLVRGWENCWIQRWMSQGMEYVNQLVFETSYEIIWSLLDSANNSKNGRLYDALLSLQDRPIDALVKELQSSDSGAYQSWFSTQNVVTLDTWIMSSENAGLRERAFLMWDPSRLETHNLAKLFADPPVAPAKYTRKDHDKMRESFNERSEVDRRGGAGYWSKGDFSRVVPKEFLIKLGRKWVPGSFTLPAGFTWIKEGDGEEEESEVCEREVGGLS
ncbi:hypothetical protein GLAREA_12164 [Glarea lozoyensis ATCC 20868]|uniref:F-box domain-containing protein n=1 Tax=Glarea lozoyensis (strain ATCC 20868 / MF5171) TaxID=1116229 RepID=S3D0M2_GLAL2|nr:uncharacterized protein GLAREA_12164 [Glarea lozoyensis ATCC 20868]EPE32082.1 hypothetical protein GLAREA_12164 [Glarea lozoyensis ATCC 20868]